MIVIKGSVKKFATPRDSTKLRYIHDITIFIFKLNKFYYHDTSILVNMQSNFYHHAYI